MDMEVEAAKGAAKGEHHLVRTPRRTAEKALAAVIQEDNVRDVWHRDQKFVVRKNSNKG
jgi:hypothetical protein